jgi:hypothetical protein
MRKYTMWVLGTVAAVATTIAAVQAQSGAQPEVAPVLQKQTQELLDAIASGDRAPWTRHLLDGMVSTVEDGSVKTGGTLIDEIRPLPPGITGTIKVTDFKAVRHGNVTITTYVADEEEGYFGQTLHAKYATTDTWLQTADGWRLAASAVLALRTDPPARDLPDAALDQYVGVYTLTPEITYTIRRTAAGLTGERTGRKPDVLKVELADCLFVPGQTRLRKIFQRDAQGRITGFVERRESWDVQWTRQRQ